MAFRDVEGHLQPGTAVERSGVVIELDPTGRRFAQVAQREQGLTVLVDPVPQAGPFPQEGLMGDLDGGLPGLGMAVQGEEAGLGPGLDRGVDDEIGRYAGQLGPGRPSTGGLVIGADDDQSLEEAPDRDPLAVVQ